MLTRASFRRPAFLSAALVSGLVSAGPWGTAGLARAKVKIAAHVCRVSFMGDHLSQEVLAEDRPAGTDRGDWPLFSALAVLESTTASGRRGRASPVPGFCGVRPAARETTLPPLLRHHPCVDELAMPPRPTIVIPSDEPVQIGQSPHLERLRQRAEIVLHTTRAASPA